MNDIHLGNNTHRLTDEPGVIILSDKIQFDKVLQRQLPPDPDSISSSKKKTLLNIKIVTYIFSSSNRFICCI
jgi:hypothetical protein